MSFLINLIIGLIFGLGLVVSGLADPEKVLNFLDITGNWDPSLALVMGAAVVTTFIGYRVVFARKKPLCAIDFDVPANRKADKSLMTGAILFGIGWGLGGICPGPAITTVGLAATGTLIFVPAMIVGMLIARKVRAS
ncbi:YeeE/YedE family protein (plasmid) [Pseudochrobactrum algeriensis]|uniref:DUF6691 family protein n=1 Tax=Pseudochrobactrum algeriensis TaxID=2834768 RepID=UPI001BCD3111|nr:DUF6691 family protein [Pseudochrobactrum algeriensis]MBX8812710.1 YeeE/YedE family protein [Ochrobactrum sp. MR34]QVQ35405.1 YeeE/YedE family protein [Pseudochrobactrum algeriensis]QVQ42020.1 YeeE/YedE family protein [Pseudochrobactrum algeriensis]QVQ42635.1 YeeE/YedE family protein [Pseudochrobactrum algeriensis]